MKRLASICVAVAQAVALCRGAATGTDIFDAVRAGDVDKVKALLQADPKLAAARTEDGSTALHLAALEGQAAISRLLLASGAQVDARGLREETPLHMAMYDGHCEVAELLLESQAEVDARNTAGETPLHLAASKGYGGAVELLLSQNADPGARDKSGQTPKAVATANGHREVVEILTPRVGEFHDLQRFVFQGAKAFPAQDLRQALKRTFDFFEVSHPLAPLDAYLEAIQGKLLVGYQHHGFPETQIEVRHDAKAGRIVVTVTEGPRYVCGGVKVTGATNVLAAAIIERLVPSQAATQSVQQAFAFQDKAPATNPLTEGSSKEAETSEPPWVKGEPAPFSIVDLQRMKTEVIAVLREHGFLFPKADVRVVPDKTARTAELQVEVLEEGPRGVVDRIEVTGNKKNSTEAVLRYLDLKPGMELNRQLVATIEDRLWRAARFLSYKVNLGSPDTGGRVPLQIQVVEYDKTPPLDQAFSRAEQAVLKSREWLAKLDESGEDMTVMLSAFPAPAPEGEFVLSPRSGLALQARDGTRQTATRDEYAVVVKGGLAGFYSSVGGRKLLIPCPKQQLTVFLNVASIAADTNESPFNLATGVGFNQLKEKGPGSSPYRFDLALSPVACMSLAHGWDCSSWFDGDVLIRSNATRLVKLNSVTGRIIEFRTTGDKGTGTMQIRFEPGAFDGAVQRIEAGTASLPNVRDTNAPLSSAVAFLLEEMMSSEYLASFLRSRKSVETAARLPALLRQFRLEEILAPLNQLLWPSNGSAGNEESFAIPEGWESAGATRSEVVRLVTGWVLQHSGELFAARSWPWTLLREASLTVQGKGKYTDQALTGIYESGETGPLGYLTVARVLRGIQPPLARKFAARGLERLSPADFRRDCQLFLAGNSISSQCLQKLAAALRDLNDEHLTALAKGESPARGEFIREGSRRLRAAKDQPMLEALGPALDSYWESELKEHVANALREQTLDASELFREGLAAYQTLSQDKAQAAKLFQQAADRGHAGAQYYLGMIYEKGAGVPKDIAAALNWYRQSVTNGYVEAGMTLGNFYSDGLDVKQDYVEAFVWYGVAAAQGNRLAEVFRKGAQRKLTPGQLAEAERRVAAILAHRPRDADVSEPASSGKDN